MSLWTHLAHYPRYFLKQFQETSFLSVFSCPVLAIPPPDSIQNAYFSLSFWLWRIAEDTWGQLQWARWTGTHQSVYEPACPSGGTQHQALCFTSHPIKTHTGEDFQSCFRQWQEWWDKVFEERGDILRGFNGNMSYCNRFFNSNIYCVFWS